MELKVLPGVLVPWYRENRRELPWRENREPYRIWVSEIMLQQTRVEAVKGYYARFLDRLPDVQALAQCDDDELHKLWEGLGYYSRVRNLKKAAGVIVSRHGGEFPRDYAAVRALPGIGDYTAGAICSIAFDLPTPAVDGNVLRVLARLRADGEPIDLPAVKKRVQGELAEIYPADCPGEFTQALMELGATVCLPNGAPKCGECPLAHMCKARAAEDFSYPKKPPKKARTVEQKAVFLLFHEDKVALRRRPNRGLLAGLYEYPDSLDGVEHEVETTVGQAVHIFTHKEWHMTAFAAHTDRENLPEGWVWADWEEWKYTYSIPSAFAAFAPYVEGHLREKE